MGDELRVSVPLVLTPEMMRAIRDSPLTFIEDRDEWYKRLGWFICAWDVLMEQQVRD